MSGARLRLSVAGPVAYLTLDAPPRNAIDRAFFRQLATLSRDELPHLPVRGLVVHGEGRHFSSGADIAELDALIARSVPGDEGLWDQALADLAALEALPYPVVAAVRGCCLGVGMELALACHYRVAAERAVFALPEATFGLLPGCGGTVRLTELTGPATAMELILTGRTILADEARALGLVDRVVPRRELLSAAEAAIATLDSRTGAR